MVSLNAEQVQIRKYSAIVRRFASIWVDARAFMYCCILQQGTKRQNEQERRSSVQKKEIPPFGRVQVMCCVAHREPNVLLYSGCLDDSKDGRVSREGVVGVAKDHASIFSYSRQTQSNCHLAPRVSCVPPPCCVCCSVAERREHRLPVLPSAAQGRTGAATQPLVDICR